MSFATEIGVCHWRADVGHKRIYELNQGIFRWLLDRPQLCRQLASGFLQIRYSWIVLSGLESGRKHMIEMISTQTAIWIIFRIISPPRERILEFEITVRPVWSLHEGLWTFKLLWAFLLERHMTWITDVDVGWQGGLVQTMLYEIIFKIMSLPQGGYFGVQFETTSAGLKRSPTNFQVAWAFLLEGHMTWMWQGGSTNFF